MNLTVTAGVHLISKITTKSLITMGKKILKCPKCGSTDIVPEAGFVTGYKYHCKECDYMGSLILEVDEDMKNVKE